MCKTALQQPPFLFPVPIRSPRLHLPIPQLFLVRLLGRLWLPGVRDHHNIMLHVDLAPPLPAVGGRGGSRSLAGAPDPKYAFDERAVRDRAAGHDGRAHLELREDPDHDVVPWRCKNKVNKTRGSLSQKQEKIMGYTYVYIYVCRRRLTARVPGYDDLSRIEQTSYTDNESPVRRLHISTSLDNRSNPHFFFFT